MTDVVVQTPDGPVAAVLEVPSGKGPWPAVVVLHDAVGLSEDIRNNVKRLADQGYLALAPDLYSRGGRARCITRVFKELLTQKGRAFDDILAARDTLTSRDDCAGTVGVVGFCMGGRFSLLVAPKGFDAAAPFYPAPLPRKLDEALEGVCPLVVSLGKRDPMLIGAGPKLEKALERNGVAHDVKSYDGCGHSFANEMPGQPFLKVTGFGYNAEATEDAWRRIFAFFGTHLAAS